MQNRQRIRLRRMLLERVEERDVLVMREEQLHRVPFGPEMQTGRWQTSRLVVLPSIGLPDPALRPERELGLLLERSGKVLCVLLRLALRVELAVDVLLEVLHFHKTLARQPT